MVSRNRGERNTALKLTMAGINRNRKLMVDGDEVKTWKNAQWLDVPKEITFEVGGKPAVLREKGLFKAQDRSLF